LARTRIGPDDDGGAKWATGDIEREDAKQSEWCEKFDASAFAGAARKERKGRDEGGALSQRGMGGGAARAASRGAPGCLRVRCGALDGGEALRRTCALLLLPLDEGAIPEARAQKIHDTQTTALCPSCPEQTTLCTEQILST
jgi:hypothetical protein